MSVTRTYERRTVRLPRFLCEQVDAYLADRPHGSPSSLRTPAEPARLGIG